MSDVIHVARMITMLPLQSIIYLINNYLIIHTLKNIMGSLHTFHLKNDSAPDVPLEKTCRFQCFPQTANLMIYSLR